MRSFAIAPFGRVEPLADAIGVLSAADSSRPSPSSYVGQHSGNPLLELLVGRHQNCHQRLVADGKTWQYRLSHP